MLTMCASSASSPLLTCPAVSSFVVLEGLTHCVAEVPSTCLYNAGRGEGGQLSSTRIALSVQRHDLHHGWLNVHQPFCDGDWCIFRLSQLSARLSCTLIDGLVYGWPVGTTTKCWLRAVTRVESSTEEAVRGVALVNRCGRAVRR